MMRNFLMIILLLVGLGLQAQTSGGPDAYGYVWKTNDNPSGPTYNWIDITNVGTQVTGLSNDNATALINMNMTFQYYWTDYTHIQIGSNGWLSFDDIGNISHCFPMMPTQGQVGDNILAPFMGDLTMAGIGSAAEVWYHYDAANQQFIVSYINIPWSTDTSPYFIGSNTFQVILSAVDKSITYQYSSTDAANFDNTVSCASDLVIGMENITGNLGLQVSSEVVPPASRAIKFEYPAAGSSFPIPDATPKWTQNIKNQASIFTANNPFDITTQITNVGSADITSPITVTIEIADLSSTLQYTNTSTISSLTTGMSSLENFTIPGLIAGQYSVKIQTANNSDINPSNNSFTTEIVVVDETQNPIELSYSSSATATDVLERSGTSDFGGATRFVPPVYPITLNEVEMYIQATNGSATAEAYTMEIRADDGVGNVPGTLLATESVAANSYTTNDWVTTTLSSTLNITSGGFYVIWKSANNVGLGMESSGPISRQTYEFVENAWASYRKAYANDFMVKANITYSPATEFITTWRTTTANESIIIPTTGGGYNYTVDWGDGSPLTTGATGDVSHTYTVAGDYMVKISGDFPRIYLFGSSTSNRDKIIDINQWGDISWTSMENAFRACANLQYSATDAPDLSNTISLNAMFREASLFNGDINNWDVSNIQSMSEMFYGTLYFDKDLNNWNVSNVLDMSRMFFAARVFNGNIDNWNVSSVLNMSEMFRITNLFNRDLNNWNVSSVNDMSWMFGQTNAFNGNITGWNVSNVSDMSKMFRFASAFNRDLTWDVSSVNDMHEMFYNASVFNGNISGWNVSAVTDMHWMFYLASSFNSDLSNWDVSSVINMDQMFYVASSFTSDLSTWNVSSVNNMQGMFGNTNVFNSDLSAWNVSNVNTMRLMFGNALAFDADLGSWDVTNVSNMEFMLTNSNLSIANYDNTLIGWSLQSVIQGVNLGATGLEYCNAANERQSLMTNYWTITGDTQAAFSNNSILVETTSSISENQSGIVHYYGLGCGELIATIEQSGTNPVTGNVTANVWKQTTVPSYNGEPYVARHYEITPATNPSTATGKITLYFTQDEFDDYNLHPNAVLKLPKQPLGLVIPDIRITQYPGVSSDGSGTPGSYTSTPIIIDPVDSDVVWNATTSVWEISIEVTGFSGFFLHTSTSNLPVELTEFRGNRIGEEVRLDWLTASETNNQGFRIEHSTDGEYFERIGFLEGQGNSSTNNVYSFIHENPSSGVNYYRLQQMDFDGNYEYSNVIIVKMPKKKSTASFYPNPVRETLQIRTSATSATILISDINGKIVYQSNWTGNEINLSHLPGGMYIISFITENEKTIEKIFKE